MELKYYVTMSVIIGNRHSGKRNVFSFSSAETKTAVRNLFPLFVPPYGAHEDRKRRTVREHFHRLVVD